ncbi:MAG: glycosyltransferase WbuB [Sphingobacteriales bacterium]|nr:MAG: glycosyltransferase WbuB [Sphingobacteriales bacterium]
MKKIVILTQYFPPETGAPQSRLYETALGLKSRGWDVSIVAAMPNYPTGRVSREYRGKFSVNEFTDGMHIHRYALYASNSKNKLPRIASMLSFSFSSLASLLKLHRLRPHYILTESPPLTLGLTGLLLAKICGARHILNVSDLWPLSAYKLGAVSHGFLYSRLKDIELFLYKRSYACTGQSQQIIDHVKKNGAHRTHLFRNGVDTKRFKPTDAAIANSTSTKIVYTGLLGVAQGVLNICRNINFKNLGVSFHIYGDGAEKNDIVAYLLANPDKGIYYHNAVHRDEIPAVLAQYDAMLVPLIKPIYGAIPSKMYEAMAAGLPVIFAGGGEGAQLVNKYNIGWTCKPANYKMMEEKILQLSQLPAGELQAIKQNCRTAAHTTFDREIQIEQLHQFLSGASA